MIAGDPGVKARSSYTVWKWWGRRYPALARAVIAGLLLRPGQEEHLYGAAALRGDSIALVRKAAGGKVLVDPFSGGGTIILEASRLGLEAHGVDANPGAVEVARATLHTACGNCGGAPECLRQALARAQDRVGHLWRTPRGGKVIHVFLTRCSREPCRAPALLASKPSGWALILDPGSPEWIREVNDGSNYRATHPQVQLPGGLPEAAPGYRVYAVEIHDSGGRRFIAIPGAMGSDARAWAEETAKTAQAMAPRTCTGIPLLRETRKLIANGVMCWEQLYTPRQLATINSFIREAEGLGCGWWARLMAANATRTCSLLAFYYQPYRRVNPGLVVKSYWLPQYPVELNPLAGDDGGTLARGTLYSYLRLLEGACSRPHNCPGAYSLAQGDARDPGSYPRGFHLLVTDPPYPGMMSYTDMSLPYLYWLGYPLPGKPINPMGGRGHLELMDAFARASLKRAAPGARMALIISSSPGEELTLAKSLALVARAGWGLARVYWLPGEAPGRMGRGRRRGVYLALYRRGPGLPGALEPLYWVPEVAGGLGLDVEAEAGAAERLAGLLEGLLQGYG